MIQKIQEKIQGKLIIDEFGNGFVNTADDIIKIIYIGKKDLNKAISGDIVEVEIINSTDKGYYGKVINYSLVNKEFIGKFHHFFNLILYCLFQQKIQM